MLTRLKIESGARSNRGLVVALAVAATLVMYFDAHGQNARDEVELLDQHPVRASPAEKLQSADVDPGDSVFVGANLLRSEPCPELGQSVDAAVPSCLDPRAAQHSLFVADGLLRMPFLVGEAADGTCR